MFWSEYVKDKTYYTESYDKSQIMRASQEGQGVQVLVGATLVAKNSLNIDINAKRVYWVDRETANQLVSIGYDGSDTTPLISSLRLFTDSTLSATHIFGDYIYWTDNRNDSILRQYERHE